jgi:hypothetical protein
MKQSIEETIEALMVIRGSLCSYRSRHGKLCDCKFGVRQIKGPNGIPMLPSGERGCGCPELYQAIGYLKQLRKTKLKEIKKGNVVKAVVFATEPYGIYLKHESGINILVKVTELDWTTEKSTSEFTYPGAEFTVKILELVDEKSVLGYDLQELA